MGLLVDEILCFLLSHKGIPHVMALSRVLSMSHCHAMFVCGHRSLVSIVMMDMSTTIITGTSNVAE
jgi:hypothetical protein